MIDRFGLSLFFFTACADRVEPAAPTADAAKIIGARNESAFRILYTQANAKQRTNEHAAAVELFRAAIAVLPDKQQTGGAWNDLGWSLYQLGRYEEAADAYRRALIFSPGLERARNNLAAVEAKLKK